MKKFVLLKDILTFAPDKQKANASLAQLQST